MFTFNPHNAPIGYPLCHQKPPPKFEIEALFRLVKLYTDTKKKTHHFKTIHSSLRSESKMYYYKNNVLIDICKL